MDDEVKKELEQEQPLSEETAEAQETAAEVEQDENELELKLKEAEEKAKESFDKYLRQVAEFDNYRKRTTAEKAAMYSNGVRDTVEKLLPVVDNFERAVNSATDTEDPLYTGVLMILKQLRDVLTELGVEEIPAEGEPFDPNYHNAVMHIDDENCDDNVVVEVFQKGYKLGDKVIRHSMVKVAN